MIRVKQGKRYRFRFINSGSQICPFQLQVYISISLILKLSNTENKGKLIYAQNKIILFQIEKHHLTLIANDGSPVRPREFDTLISTSGERYDFVLNANQTIGIIII